MNAYLSVLALIFVTGLLILVPVIPATIELYRKADAQPLLVIQRHAGDIRHFSEGFRSYVNELKPILEKCQDSQTTARGKLKDNSEYFVLGDSSVTSFLEARTKDGNCSTVVIGCSDLRAPAVTHFSKEIYSRGHFDGGGYNHYRAILGEKDVQLGAHSVVMRWIHSVGIFSAGHDCDLHGRISSDSAIRLGRGCNFVRVNAPRIELGAIKAEPTPAHDSSAPINAHTSTIPKRYLYDDDFEIQPGQIFEGNIVTRGRLLAHRGAQIFGSIKSNKEMILEDEVLVTGSAISSGQLHIGPDCRVHGPIIAERALYVGSGARLGTPAKPTTVSSPTIFAKENVVIFGTLWAREHGEVTRG